MTQLAKNQMHVYSVYGCLQISLLTFVMCGCHGNLPQMFTLVNIINIKNATYVCLFYSLIVPA